MIRKKPALQVVLLTLLGTAIGTVLVLMFPWFPEDASIQSKPIDDLYLALMVASAFIFSLVLSVVVISILHFRKRPGQREDGPPIHGNTTLEVVWTAIPAAIVTVIAIFSAVVLADIEEEKPHTETVLVTGEQFAWSFNYPAWGIAKTGVLHLVKDRPYYFKIESKDVIHSFWVPEFRIKKDAVPGITTTARVTPTKVGRYSLVCAELCGLGHSTMRARVVVEDQGSFQRWARQAKKFSLPAAVSPAGGAGQ